MCQEQREALRIASRSQVQPQPPWSFCFHKQTRAMMQEASEGALRGGAHCDLSVTDFMMERPRPLESTKNSQLRRKKRGRTRTAMRMRIMTAWP